MRIADHIIRFQAFLDSGQILPINPIASALPDELYYRNLPPFKSDFTIMNEFWGEETYEESDDIFDTLSTSSESVLRGSLILSRSSIENFKSSVGSALIGTGFSMQPTPTLLEHATRNLLYDGLLWRGIWEWMKPVQPPEIVNDIDTRFASLFSEMETTLLEIIDLELPMIETSLEERLGGGLALASLGWIRKSLCFFPQAVSNQTLHILVEKLLVFKSTERMVEDRASETVKNSIVALNRNLARFFPIFRLYGPEPLNVDFPALLYHGCGTEADRNRLANAAKKILLMDSLPKTWRGHDLNISENGVVNAFLRAETLQDALATSAVIKDADTVVSSTVSKIRSLRGNAEYRHHLFAATYLLQKSQDVESTLFTRDLLHLKLFLHFTVAILPTALEIGPRGMDAELQVCHEELDRQFSVVRWCDITFADKLLRIYNEAWPFRKPLKFGHVFLMASDCGPSLLKCDMDDAVELLRSRYGKTSIRLMERLYESPLNSGITTIAKFIRPFDDINFPLEHFSEFGIIISENEPDKTFPKGIPEKWKPRDDVAMIMSTSGWCDEIEPLISKRADQYTSEVVTKGLPSNMTIASFVPESKDEKFSVAIRILVLRRVILGCATFFKPNGTLIERLGYVRDDEADIAGADTALNTSNFTTLLSTYGLSQEMLKEVHRKSDRSDRIFDHERRWLQDLRKKQLETARSPT